MIPHVGIDLGTTFSCMSYIDENGLPAVIKNSDGAETTPSVIWLDGKLAYVGKKANDRKLQANAPIYEFVKRDIGKDRVHRYVINGYNYGACGLSAIILKKLRIEAFNFFKKKGWLSQEDTLQSLIIPAVITVPAYFRDKQRHETRLAGIAAGFDVIAIVNEPTAAALTYGINLDTPQTILVFDLGGGTFDVTILKIGKGGQANVITSDGADQLGGKDWDAIIERHLFNEFEAQTKQEVPDDMGWELQKIALDAKFALSEKDQTNVILNASGESADITLYRERPSSVNDLSNLVLVDDDDNKFYFEERSFDKLTLCKTILLNTLEKAGISWNSIDEILLAGGSSRMPMIRKMLEKLARRTIKQNIPGFNYDTAIAQGAALYGRNKSRVVDVSSKSIGIEIKTSKGAIVEHFIKKNSPLPISISQTIPAEANAVLKIYEGEEESENPKDWALRGKLELGNPSGDVTVNLSIDFNGVIFATVEANEIKAQLKIKSDSGDIDVSELKDMIDKIDVRL